MALAMAMMKMMAMQKRACKNNDDIPLIISC
jgi:hypothetical protein